MIARIEHANFTVPDVDAAIGFLRCVEPDFRILHDGRAEDGHRWVHLGTEAGYFALEEPHEPTPDAIRARRYADYGVNHIGIVVADVDAVAERLMAAGYPETFQSEHHPARIRRYFHDPGGFEWELVQYLTDDPGARFSYG